MRKKLFAIVMSMTMVASFMPSLAFAAATHTYLHVGTDFTVDAQGKAVVKSSSTATQKDVDKYVKVVKAPSHSPKGLVNGLVEVACSEPFCDEVDEQVVTASHDADGDLVQRNFTLEEWAAIGLAQGDFANKTAADKAVKDWKKGRACYIKNAKVCSCGYATWTETVYHEVNTTCADKECPQCHETIKATGEHHVEAVNPLTATKVSEPTCGKGTGYASKCSVCKAPAVWYNNDVKADSHSFGTPVSEDVAVSSDKSGVKKVKDGYIALTVASQANDKVTAGDIISAGEVWNKTGDAAKPYKFYALNKVVTEGDCTHGAVMGLECVNCSAPLYTSAGVKYEKQAAAAGHDFDSTKVDATCDADAYMHKVCKVCGTEENTPIAGTKLAHTYKVTKTDATCGSGEYYTIECTTCPEKCGNTHKVKYTLDSAGTDLEVYETDNTAKTKTFVFKGFDGEFNTLPSKQIKITFSTAPLVNHKWGAETLLKEATCVDNEIWGYKCTECGKIATHEVAGKVPAPKLNTKLGHDLVKTETAATCGSYGFYTEQCSRCGLYKDAAGNVDETELKNAKVVKTDKPVVKEGAKCSFDKWVVTKKATVFEEGVKSLECSVCGNDGSAKTVIAKAKYAAPAVKAGKKSATVTVKATADAVSYKISYKKAGGSYKTIAAKAGKKTIKKLAKGKKYTFKAIAVNAEGVEVASATKTVKVK